MKIHLTTLYDDSIGISHDEIGYGIITLEKVMDIPFYPSVNTTIELKGDSFKIEHITWNDDTKQYQCERSILCDSIDSKITLVNYAIRDGWYITVGIEIYKALKKRVIR